MIPKIIHYCWFGEKPLTEMGEKCIQSWKKYCPEYKIIRWDESNFDINYNDYVREAYDSKKFAFVSDVARLYAIVNNGGIYMDTDVEIIQSLDGLLVHDGVSGFESDNRYPTGLMGCEKNNPLFYELLHDYDGKHFIDSDGKMDTTTNIFRIMNRCSLKGVINNNTFQQIPGLTLYPSDYLCPKNHRTMKINITKNTIAIHHFDGSWISQEERYKRKLCVSYINLGLPEKFASPIARLITIIKYNGIKKTPKLICERIKKNKRNEF